jgi:hypothetical protein
MQCPFPFLVLINQLLAVYCFKECLEYCTTGGPTIHLSICHDHPGCGPMAPGCTCGRKAAAAAVTASRWMTNGVRGAQSRS